PNGKVLIAGGCTGCGGNGGAATFLSSTELYDPGANVFSAVPAMNTLRAFNTATLPPNGKVLLGGGAAVITIVNGVPTGGGALKSTELYDPVTNTFAAPINTASMSAFRERHTATLLPNGKVLIAGGDDNVSVPNSLVILNSTELYDPATNTFSSGPSMKVGRFGAGASIFDTGTEVLIAGGYVDAGNDSTTATNTVELYDVATNTFEATPLPMAAPHIPISILTANSFVLLCR
ncbi:MAG: Kelch repeat-containing protein, partial [Bryobacteraceae bacterium]